jgi:hypothetical protein
MTDQRSLSVYLNDHLTGATGGRDLFRRAAGSQSGPRGTTLSRLAAEVDQDREALRGLMRRLGVLENRPMAALGWLGEKAGRLKPNGYVVRRSPLADVIELEGLRAAVQAKLAGWQVLREVARHDDRITTGEIDALVRRAEEQATRLEDMHRQVAAEHLAG